MTDSLKTSLTARRCECLMNYVEQESELLSWGRYQDLPPFAQRVYSESRLAAPNSVYYDLPRSHANIGFQPSDNTHNGKDKREWKGNVPKS